MGYLAAADATAMEAATQAQCLRTLEQLHAIETAARASVLGALASSRAGAGRADAGRADTGRADTGRADTGRTGAGRADPGRAGAADFSPRAWLVRETGVTAGAATGHAAWARRAAGHPQVIETLAEGHLLSESVARTICTWTDKLPADCRVAADAILIVAAKTGANPRDLAEVFGGIYTLARPRPGLVPVLEPAVISAVAI
jgi:hypothetical protein